MYRLKQITLLLGDMLMLYLGLYLAITIRHLGWSDFTFIQFTPIMSPLFALAGLIIFVTGLYDLEKNKNNRANFGKIAISMSVWLVFGLIYFYLDSSRTVSPKTILILNGIFGLCLISIWRFFYNKFISQSIWKINVVFAGLDKEIEELLKTLHSQPQLGYNIAGIVDENYAKTTERFAGYKIYDDIQSALNCQKIELIVLSPSLEQDKEFVKKIISHIYRQIQIMPLANFYELTTGRIPIFALTDSWLISNLHEQNKKIYDRVKLILDLLCAGVMAVFFLTTLPFVALLIKINSRGPIFFKQTRVGLAGREFHVIKYRTMYSLNSDGSAETSGPQFSSDQDQRITMIGKFLRQTRLDEIPQFINIFKREMSIVGPRPERPEFVKQMSGCTPYYHLRHLIKPGLTGWAQIKHGYAGNLEENLRKLEYDLHYIKNRGPMLDFIIILRTINTITRLSGK